MVDNGAMVINLPIRPRPVRLLAPVTVSVALALTSCSTEPTPPTTAVTPSATSSARPGEAEARSPLTGLPITSQTAARTVFAVKVENTEGGRPQRGVGDADLVVEEPVEGGLTRLAAMYQSKYPSSVGPVRSTRTTDIGLVEPLDAPIVTSGMSWQAQRVIDRAGVTIITEPNAAFTRDADRVAPYDLFVDLAKVRKEHKPDPPTQSYLPFGDAETLKGRPVRSADITWLSAAEHWTFLPRTKKWRRSAPGGGVFNARNLLVLRVRERMLNERDSAGTRVPEALTTGRGRGTLLTEDQLVRVRWSKAGPSAPYKLTSGSGAALTIPSGATWISLVPLASGGLTTS